MPEVIGNCWACGQALERMDYARESRCPKCQKPTHSCRNCRFYAPNRPNECQEPLVERIVDKTRGNFCEWLQPTKTAYTSKIADPEALKRAVETLFKN